MVNQPPEPTKGDRTFLEAPLWAALWSTILTIFIYLSIYNSGGCFFIVNDPISIGMVVGLTWVWLFLFLCFRNRGRLILTACSAFLLLLFFTLGPSDIISGNRAREEASVVGRLHQLAQSIESYRKEHSQEGYPQTLKIPLAGHPVNLGQVYEFHYITWRSKLNGPVDGFLIQATPKWPECGYPRSFAAAEDGHIHFASECRPATKTDPVIDPPSNGKSVSP